MGPVVPTRHLIFISYITSVNGTVVYIIVDFVSQISHSNGMAGVSQQDTERPRLDVILDNQYLVLKGTGSDVDPTTLSGHVRLVLTEPTSIKEITLQFKGKAKIPVLTANSYDFLVSSNVTTDPSKQDYQCLRVVACCL